ncbi:MAG TPA: phosphodiester glycosidase family protein [Armatimonadota bacterium]|jgi:uncharacterized protein YigE (DUF2233 family)
MMILRKPLGEGNVVYVCAARVDSASWKIQVVKRDAGATASAVCPATGMAINAPFFDMQTLTPIGLLVIDGKKIAPRYNGPCVYGDWGVFVLRGTTPQIIAGLDHLPADAVCGVQCAPLLVINGTIPPFKSKSPALRAAVGIDAQGRTLFAVSQRNELTFAQWAMILRDDLGCVNALNLDGGPSAQLAAGDHRKVILDGCSVPVFLTAEPMDTKPATTTPAQQ